MPFNTQALELKKIFKGLVKGFGLNHGQIYYALMSSEVKTAPQLIQETGVNQATTYSVLRDLVKWELIEFSNTAPTNYFTNDPIKTFEKVAKLQEKKIQKRRKLLENIIIADSQEEARKYLLKIGKGDQLKLFDMMTKKELKYREELLQVKERVDRLLKEAPEKERKNACFYY